MLPADVTTRMLETLDERDLMALRPICKDWKQTCETIIRDEIEHDVKHMLNSCRYKCEKVPWKWIVRRNSIQPAVHYKCAYCNATVYALGECRHKHRKLHKIIQDTLVGPAIAVLALLFVFC